MQGIYTVPDFEAFEKEIRAHKRHRTILQTEKTQRAKLLNAKMKQEKLEGVRDKRGRLLEDTADGKKTYALSAAELRAAAQKAQMEQLVEQRLAEERAHWAETQQTQQEQFQNQLDALAAFQTTQTPAETSQTSASTPKANTVSRVRSFSEPKPPA